MELLNQPLGEGVDPQTALYHCIKSCYSYVEMHNVFSLRLMQAAVLISVYEVANGIYPAAYLTVGHCARLGHAMGLHKPKIAQQMLPTPGKAPLPNLRESELTLLLTAADTWTEHEERRRIWWAIIILDR